MIKSLCPGILKALKQEARQYDLESWKMQMEDALYLYKHTPLIFLLLIGLSCTTISNLYFIVKQFHLAKTTVAVQSMFILVLPMGLSYMTILTRTLLSNQSINNLDVVYQFLCNQWVRAEWLF